MGDRKKFSNDTPDLQDALRSIEATGEDSGATSDGTETDTPSEATFTSDAEQ